MLQFAGQVPLGWEGTASSYPTTADLLWSLLNGLNKHPAYLLLGRQPLTTSDPIGQWALRLAARYAGVSIDTTPGVWVALRRDAVHLVPAAGQLRLLAAPGGQRARRPHRAAVERHQPALGPLHPPHRRRQRQPRHVLRRGRRLPVRQHHAAGDRHRGLPGRGPRHVGAAIRRRRTTTPNRPASSPRPTATNGARPSSPCPTPSSATSSTATTSASAAGGMATSIVSFVEVVKGEVAEWQVAGGRDGTSQRQDRLPATESTSLPINQSTNLPSPQRRLRQRRGHYAALRGQPGRVRRDGGGR